MKALITGASSGIGKDMAKILNEKGYDLVLVARDEERLQETKQELEQSNKNSNVNQERNNKIEIISMDRTDEEKCKNLAQNVQDIDILINNAGISEYKLFTDENDDDWNRIINTNLYSAFAMSQEVIPNMIHNKKGCIINMSSVWGIVGGALEVIYSVSKAGLDGLTKALAKELGPSNIRVNSIAPGIINTNMNEKFSKEEIEQIKEEIEAFSTALLNAFETSSIFELISSALTVSKLKKVSKDMSNPFSLAIFVACSFSL